MTRECIKNISLSNCKNVEDIPLLVAQVVHVLLVYMPGLIYYSVKWHMQKRKNG